MSEGDLIIVRTATGNELEAIRAIDRMTLGNDSRGAFLREAVDAGKCLAAMIEDETVGFGVLEQNFYRQGFIALLVVHPDYRLRGVATTLLRKIEEICPTEKLFTSTNVTDTPAQKMYEANGFVPSGYINNLDEGDPEIVYFKRLEKVGSRVQTK